MFGYFITTLQLDLDLKWTFILAGDRQLTTRTNQIHLHSPSNIKNRLSTVREETGWDDRRDKDGGGVLFRHGGDLEILNGGTEDDIHRIQLLIELQDIHEAYFHVLVNGRDADIHQ